MRKQLVVLALAVVLGLPMPVAAQLPTLDDLVEQAQEQVDDAQSIVDDLVAPVDDIVDDVEDEVEDNTPVDVPDRPKPPRPPVEPEPEPSNSPKPKPDKDRGVDKPRPRDVDSKPRPRATERDPQATPPQISPGFPVPTTAPEPVPTPEVAPPGPTEPPRSDQDPETFAPSPYSIRNIALGLLSATGAIVIAVFFIERDKRRRWRKEQLELLEITKAARGRKT